MKWAPVKNDIIKDETIKDIIHKDGYTIIGNIGKSDIDSLLKLFNQTHKLNYENGGTFYSLFSKDKDYRLKIHNDINEILVSMYNKYFKNYKVIINSFIVKLPGPNSNFALHQDSSGLDEYQFSPLSLWIPLQKTNLENGTLCIIPKSHGLYHPYRGLSITPSFAKYESLLKKYLVPLNFEAGDILVFDNRLIHFSPLNNTKQPRIVSLSGLFPENAEIQVCYKDEKSINSPIEIYKQEDDFVRTNTTFLEGNTERPIVGKKIREIHKTLEPITMYDFLEWANINRITPTNILELCTQSSYMTSFSEPISVN